uniref:Uncharacterized protein n=1 Tax=Panagrolaimus sp. ES5 TaxID=591445 RepID=A0AC34GN40_9BILA
MENQYFEDPYNSQNIQPQSVTPSPTFAATAAEHSNSNDSKTKLLDLVFDENGNIVQHIVTSNSDSNVSEQ